MSAQVSRSERERERERESSHERLTGNPNHHVPTPTSSDGIERKSTNVGASNGELCFETNKSVSLDRWVKMNPEPKDELNLPTADSRQPTTPHSWPTPRTRSLCGGSGSAEMIDKLATDGTISSEERKAMRGGGKLNPEWVEWLMGWPIGWTALDSQATAWFRSKPRSPGKGSKKSRKEK